MRRQSRGGQPLHHRGPPEAQENNPSGFKGFQGYQAEGMIHQMSADISE